MEGFVLAYISNSDLLGAYYAANLAALASLKVLLPVLEQDDDAPQRKRKQLNYTYHWLTR
jgi:hypothetical protein